MDTPTLPTIVRFLSQVVGVPPVDSDASPPFDGLLLYDALAQAVPTAFDADVLKRGTDVWMLWKANLAAVVDGVNQYSQDYLSARGNVVTVDPVAIARDKDVAQLTTLAEATSAVCVLSGGQHVLQKVKALEKADQDVLQGIVKRLMQAYGIKKAKKPDGSTATGAAAASSSASGSAAAGSRDGAANGRDTSPPPAPVGVGAAPTEAGRSDDDFRRIKLDRDRLTAEVERLMNDMRLQKAQQELLEQKAEETEGKYRKLLEQSGSKGVSTRERELQTQLTKKDEVIVQLESTVDGLRQQVEQITEREKRALVDRERVMAENAEMGATVKQWTQRNKELLEQLRVAEDVTSVNVTQRERLEAEVAKLHEERQQLSSRTSTHKDAMQELRQEIATRDSQLAAAKKQIASLQASVAAHQASASDDGGDVAAILATLRADLEQERNTSEALRGELEAAKSAAASSSASSQASAGVDSAELAKVRDRLEIEQRLTQETTQRLEEATDRHQKAIQQLEKVQKLYDTELQETRRLGEHLNHATAEIARLRAAASTAEGAQAEKLELDKVKKELADIREKNGVARVQMLGERAVLMSTVFECGQRNLQLQQRLLAGHSVLSPADWYKDAVAVQQLGAATATGSGRLTFFEAHRRTFEMGVLAKSFTKSSADGGRR